MLALIYLVLIFLLGDAVCRKIYSFRTLEQRVASAFIVGLLFGTATTYLSALCLASTEHVLRSANLTFLFVSIAVVFLLREPFGDSGRTSLRYLYSIFPLKRPVLGEEHDGDSFWDWFVFILCLLFGCWLMFSTLTFGDGNFEFAIKSWSDFGANLSLSQSLALGHNFPTEHPFFAGEPIRYHFLFWFQAANLSYLGLNLAWSVNLLSMLSLAALLILLKTFSQVLFNSRVVGRLTLLLFFLASSSLSYIPFLLSKDGFLSAISSIIELKDYLPSGYPYRGDNWGGLTVGVYSNQRHLISGAAILLIVVIYLVELYRKTGFLPFIGKAATSRTAGGEDQKVEFSPGNRREMSALLFSGLLIGALPYWNSAIFVSALVVIAGLVAFLPYRKYVMVVAATAVVIGLPQVLMLRSGAISQTTNSLWHFGYTIENATVWLVFKYVLWTFGFKLVLIALALWLVPGSYRRLFLAFTGLLIVVFSFQLSTDAFNNHKLINVWVLLASSYVAYALWSLFKRGVWQLALAGALGVLTVFGAVADLFPIHNDHFVSVPYENDRLTSWLLAATQPSDVFLSDTLLSHPILFTGRKIFLGNTLFAWTAGYPVVEREKVYRKMLQEQDRAKLLAMLHEHNIRFVAVDDNVRRNKDLPAFNESIYKQNFEKVFEDTEKSYSNLTIYSVPYSEG